MGSLGGGRLRRGGGVWSQFILVVSVAVFLIGLERVYTFESAASGGWLSAPEVTASPLSRDRPDEKGSRSLLLAPAAEDELTRRELLSGSGYISYGALSASHIPCPPRSGRSYYTPNCRSATGPVQPYRRGCSRITRCRRG